MKFSKANWEILCLGWNNPTHQYWLGTDWLEISFAKKDLVVLVDDKLNMSEQCDFAAKVTNPTLVT